MLALEPRPRPTDAQRCIGRVLGSIGPTAIPGPPENVETLIELAGLPCLARKPQGTSLSQWIADTLVHCRGVMAALPRNVWPASAIEADSTIGRIVTLDPTRAIGQSWWWLWRLKASEYTHRTAYAVDDCTSVYHTDGLEGKANSWLPANADYDALVLGIGFDRITLAGFAMTVRYMPPPTGDARGILDRLPALHQRMLLELEAGAMASGPAVLATMLVHSNDNYKMYQSTAANADQDTAGMPRLTGDPGRVVACMTVTQTHSFRLTDLLLAYNKVLGHPVRRPTLPAMDGSVYELTMAVARRVRALSKNRILKLNMTSDAVVFCPHLTEDDDGNMQAHGYGYEGMEAVRGVPYLWDFDPLYTKRVSSQTPDYDVDCAYVTMMLAFLASVRAQHGETVSIVMINRMIGRNVEGAALTKDDLPEDFEQFDLTASAERMRDKASSFCGILRSMLPVFATEYEPTLGTAYMELARDFEDIARTDSVRHWRCDTVDRPVFAALVRYLSCSAVADTCVFNEPAAHGEALLERERAHRVEQRLDGVRAARAARMRSPG